MSQETQLYAKDRRRLYLQCQQCQLVYVPAQYRLTAQAEKAEYDKHQNNEQDNGYRRFLARTTTPLFAQLAAKPHDNRRPQGLDFGCGPGPAIKSMAAEAGYLVENYDLYYYNQPELLQKRYDFITMTEVIEHIAKPAILLKQLNGLLHHQGILAVMTKRRTDLPAFKNWHYKNDPTHICFYSIACLEWVARKMGWRLEVIDKDVVFFHKE
ncbi:class I SAM-dependent methyltransferase [Aliikangiella sp. IMCC44653]